MKLISQLSFGLGFLFLGLANSSYGGPTEHGYEFSFDVFVPKNTCDISVQGTSVNLVDFGNVPLKQLELDASQGKVKLPFRVSIISCKTTNYDNNYITLTGNYTNDGFMDDVNKTFAVRISEKDNLLPNSPDYVTDKNTILWKDIKSNNVNKTFYAYLMCKNGVQNCAVDQNVGRFKATLTMTYMTD